GRPPSRSRSRPGPAGGATRAGTPRRTASRCHLRRRDPEDRIDRVARRLPLCDAGGERAPPGLRPAGGLAGRPAVARGAVGLDEALALQPPEQGVDRPFADDREAAGPEPFRHLVAVGRLFLDDAEQAEVEHAAEQLAAPLLVVCHAVQGTSESLALQGSRVHKVTLVRPTLYEFAGGEGGVLALARAHPPPRLARPRLNHPFP